MLKFLDIQLPMFKHLWNTAIRNLWKQRRFTAINLIGLSLSIAVFLALNGYVSYHLSFDQFYKDGERIFRVDYFEYQDGQPVLESSRTHDRTALLVHAYVPQVEAVTRVYNEKAYIFTEDVRIVDQDMLYVDSSFFKVFNLKMIEGDAEQALVPPKAVVISQKAASQYFGNENPMGKTLYFNERLPFVVTGVFQDIPKTSSIDYDFLLSWSTLSFYGWAAKDGSFNSPYTFTYVKLRPGFTDLATLNNQLTRIANDHITTLVNRGHTAKHELRPYNELHFLEPLTGEAKAGVNKTLLYALISLSIFVLIAAWMNYVNLSLAQSLGRAGEIGVRKVFGASRIAISGQFLLEACLLATVTFLLGATIFYVFTSPLSYVLFADVSFAVVTPPVWILYFILFVTGTALASFYPSHFMSKLKPVLILRNKLGTGKGKANQLQQVLMIFQLFLAVAVVGITFIAQRQISFMRNFNSGFNTTHTISLRGPASTNSDSLRQVRYNAFRQEALQLPGFKSGASSMNVPGEEIRFHDDAIRAVGSSNEKQQSLAEMWIDDGYQDTYGMVLVGGRNFKLKESKSSCIINETAARALGFNNPADAVSATLKGQENRTLVVVGVWKDYHHESVHKPVVPILFISKHPHEYGYFSFQLESTHSDFLPALEKIWNRHFPNDTFTCYFMDDFFEQQYKSDQLFGKLLSLFGVISILIACLGLLGMASLAMVKRTKEIGVRKVLGASVGMILLMLSKQYVRLIVISTVVSFPVVWFITSRWLHGFSYKIDVSWWMVVVPGLIVLLASLLTISGQAIRAARSNPAKVLRDQ